MTNYEGIPNNIIKAIVDSNDTRKKHIADQILAREPKTVGIYRLTMKTGSDNFRQSAIQDVITHVRNAGVEVIVHEPVLNAAEFEGIRVENDFDAFIGQADVIVANRMDEALQAVKEKVYTRDVFSRD